MFFKNIDLTLYLLLLSVAMLCLTLCDSMDCSMPCFLNHHHLTQSLPKFIFVESVMPSKYLIFSVKSLGRVQVFATPGFPVHHQLLELAQTCVHWVGDAIQTSHPPSFPSTPAFNLSQHQGLFQWVSCLHQVTEVLELQLQHQSFQRVFRVDFL